jgi:hypothetical protein
MHAQPHSSGRAHLIAIVALLAFAIGLTVWFTSFRHASILPPAASGPSPDTTTDAAIEQALGAARIDSVAYKSRWLDEVPGISLAALSPGKRELFLRFANAERCTCGCGYTLATCRAADMTCEVSGPHLEALLDSVRAGRIQSARGVRARPSSGG